MSSLRQRPRHARPRRILHVPRRTGRRSAGRRTEGGWRARRERGRARAGQRPRAQLRENIEYVRWPGCGLQLRRRAVRPGLK